MHAHLPGDLLDGRYVLGERLGSGGMGAVYRAHDTRLDRTVAIKLLHPGRDVDDVMRARLQAEARFAGALQHTGIVQVFDYGEHEPGTPYVVMQYVEGQPLSRLLRDSGPLPASTVTSMLQDLGEALAVAHAHGIVHRDLKPGNILIDKTGRAVLVDFGIARSDGADPLTETGLIIGSADYLSPEQVRGQRATAAADVYALGIVAYQCLSATSPFRRDTQAGTALARLQEDAPELPDDIPRALRTLIRRMMAAEPQDRPTAAEVAALAAAVDHPRTVAIPPVPSPIPARPSPRTAPRRPRGRGRLLAGAVAAAILLVTGSVVLVRGGDVTTPPADAADLVVPSVQGQPVAKAVRTLRAAGFEVDKRPTDGPAAPGQVLHQSPRPGTHAGMEQVTVTLRVSSGWVGVPDHGLLGTTYAAARRELANLGLTTIWVGRPSTTGVGTVVAVDPQGRVRVGSPVTLTVATAVAAAPATTPDAGHRTRSDRQPRHTGPSTSGKSGKPGKAGNGGRPGGHGKSGHGKSGHGRH